MLALLTLASAASAAPFHVRDQNPLLAGFGLPQVMPARIPVDWQLAADYSWGNSALVKANARESLVVDAETREFRFTAGRGLAAGFAVQLQIPYRYTGGGTLDGFIDDWHDWFGFSDGPRRSLPQDAYRVTYRRDGQTLIDRSAATEGLGDISADFGYQLTSNAAAPVAVWLSVKLPTGDADDLTGSGAADASLVVAAERRFANRWSAFGQAGVSYLGAGDVLGERQKSIAWSGMAGVGVNVWRGLDLKLQLDAHSAAFNGSQIGFLGEALILTVGGSYDFGGWLFDAGVSEDVKVEAAPDVVLVLGLRKSF